MKHRKNIKKHFQAKPRPELSYLPAISSDGITFAYFNNRVKIAGSDIRTWAAILDPIPNARLVLKPKALEDIQTSQQLFGQFVDHHWT